MLLYRTAYSRNDGDEPTDVIWSGTQADATRERKAMKRDYLKPETETVDVPTNKVGLLAWLNANANQA